MFVIACVLVSRVSTPIKQAGSIDKFDALDSSQLNTYIDTTIDSVLLKKYSNLKLIIDNTEVKTEQSIDILQNDSPLGHVSYFYQKPISGHWLECIGQTIYKEDYPSFFETINKGVNEVSQQKTQLTIPNLVGRMIVGAGEINKTQGSGTATLNNNNNAYDISTAAADTNKVAFRVFDDGESSINLKSGDTSGYDYCNDSVSVKKVTGSNIQVCKSKSNMPPHYNLVAFIKVKNDYFKVVY